MAVKRRTIWMSDEEWAGLQENAKLRGENMSTLIRGMWEIAAQVKLAGGDPLVVEDRIRELEDNNRRLQETIVFLDEEIARLKRELAAQPTIEGEKWERDAWVAEAHKTIVYQPTILPPTRPDGRPIGSFGTSHPAPKPPSKKR